MSALEWLAIVLIAVAVVMIFGELFTPTHGVLAIIGVILLFVGGFLLLRDSDLGLRDVVLPMILGIAVLVLVVGGGYAFRLRHMAPLTGREAMVGRTGAARSDLDPRGFVYVNGEYWSAESDGGSVQEGDAVIITEVNGLSLKVRKLTSKGAPQ
jgi:membrane-bound serine protease (ClpP class)